MIEADHVSRKFESRGTEPFYAVDDVSLQVPSGEIVAITGPSGSGKTTLLMLLGAMIRPTSGTVRLGGRNLADCSDSELARMRRRIGFVFQSSPLIRRLSVWENVTYPLIPNGIRPSERYERARRVLERLGIEHKMGSRPDQLSGGEQQRVAMARALVGQPEVILADEPSSNLDATSADGMIHALSEIHASGVTLVLSSHDPAMLSLADTIYTLEAGQLV